MPRPVPTHAARAARIFLRGTSHTSPHAAIQAGARTEEEWTALLEGQHARFWAENGRRARRAVRARHPMRQDEA
ncbi:hypothetical protein K7W42_20375 [Deinococcus sp. HMF7604]|uniref:hypothetical protein n=1 Tax=Deinococcus betulae TaxID=2873312 RepID=UPI001CCD61B6|nr:hypothetical protein [Deinococcus betulae]MBZ9753196.1 hypothetical protein [Deinococcus betulae]